MISQQSVGLQFLWYLVVGGLAFVVDIAAFVALHGLEMRVIPASMSSFVLATCANYYLSYKLAFTLGRYGRLNEIGRLLAVLSVLSPLEPALATAGARASDAAARILRNFIFLPPQKSVQHGEPLPAPQLHCRQLPRLARFSCATFATVVDRGVTLPSSTTAWSNASLPFATAT